MLANQLNLPRPSPHVDHQALKPVWHSGHTVEWQQWCRSHDELQQKRLLQRPKTVCYMELRTFFGCTTKSNTMNAFKQTRGPLVYLKRTVHCIFCPCQRAKEFVSDWTATPEGMSDCSFGNLYLIRKVWGEGGSEAVRASDKQFCWSMRMPLSTFRQFIASKLRRCKRGSWRELQPEGWWSDFCTTFNFRHLEQLYTLFPLGTDTHILWTRLFQVYWTCKREREEEAGGRGNERGTATSWTAGSVPPHLNDWGGSKVSEDRLTVQCSTWSKGGLSGQHY